MPQNLLVATSNLPQVLVSKLMEAGETTQYQCPSGAQASAVKIATATLCNTSAAAVTVSVSVLKSPLTSADAAKGRILSNYSLAANDSIRLAELNGALLGAGDIITATTSSINTVAFVLTGAVST